MVNEPDGNTKTTKRSMGKVVIKGHFTQGSVPLAFLRQLDMMNFYRVFAWTSFRGAIL